MMNSWMGRTCIAVLVAAVISGCGGAEQTPNDRQTPPIRPSTESPSLTPTPTADEILTEPEREYPEPPVRPAEMARDDVDGAVAAAEYFVMLYPYVYATGDLGEWEAMSHPDCKFCGSVRTNVMKLHVEGGISTGPEISFINSSGAPPDKNYEYYSAWLDVEAGVVKRYDENSNLKSSYPAATLEIDLAIERVSAEWLIRGVVLSESTEASGFE